MKKKYIISLIILILLPVIFSITLMANSANEDKKNLKKVVEKYEHIEDINGKQIIKRKGAYIKKEHKEYNYIKHEEKEEILTYDHSEVTEFSEMDMYLNEEGDIYGYDVEADKITYMFKRFENFDESNINNKLEEKDILLLAEEFIKENLSYSEKYKIDKIYYSEDVNTYYTTFYAFEDEYKLASFCVINFTGNGEVKNYLFKDEFEKFINLDKILVDSNKLNENILTITSEDDYENYEIIDNIIDVIDGNIFINYYIYFYKEENCIPKTIQIEYNDIKNVNDEVRGNLK